MRSSIRAEEIVIAGKVYGDVTVDRRLIMTGTGELHGNISAGALSITEGSLLNGSIAMQEQPTSEKAGEPKSNMKKDKAAKRSSKAEGTLEAG